MLDKAMEEGKKKDKKKLQLKKSMIDTLVYYYEQDLLNGCFFLFEEWECVIKMIVELGNYCLWVGLVLQI